MAGGDGNRPSTARAWGPRHFGWFGGGVSRCEMTMARRNIGGIGSGQVGWTQDFGVQDVQKLQLGYSVQDQVLICSSHERKKELIITGITQGADRGVIRTPVLEDNYRIAGVK